MLSILYQRVKLSDTSQNERRIKLKYYVMETTEKVEYVKTKRVWRNKEEAARETGFDVKWIAPITFTTYLALQLRKKILKKSC